MTLGLVSPGRWPLHSHGNWLRPACRSGTRRLVDVVGCLARCTGSTEDLVLDLEELLGVRLTFHTHEEVARLINGTETPLPVADSARPRRSRHDVIFALQAHSGRRWPGRPLVGRLPWDARVTAYLAFAAVRSESSGR